MIQNRGLNARTNFAYTKAEVIAILLSRSILDMKKGMKTKSKKSLE